MNWWAYITCKFIILYNYFLSDKSLCFCQVIGYFLYQVEVLKLRTYEQITYTYLKPASLEGNILQVLKSTFQRERVRYSQITLCVYSMHENETRKGQVYTLFWTLIGDLFSLSKRFLPSSPLPPAKKDKLPKASTT